MKRLLLLLLLALPVFLWPSPASAHPLGNFSVNQAVALTLAPASVTAHVSIDFAELPTLSAKPTADLSGRAVCTAFGSSFSVSGLRFTLDSSSFAYEPGAAGLSTSRVICGLHAAASLRPGSVLTVANEYLADRVGWREIVAVGSGLALSTTLPAASPSADLRSYPADLLSSPVNVRSGTIRITGLATSSLQPSSAAVLRPSSGFTTGFEQRLSSLVGSRSLTPLTGLLAVLLSLVLGAAHAALPGHGKTVMAAYMAGRDGRPRDALAVGATVTLTHTGGVLVLGLALTGIASLAGDRVLGGLGVASGVLIAAVGVFLLVRALAARSHGHSHGHFQGPQDHSHSRGPHEGSHSHGPGRSDGLDHSHSPGHSDGPDHSHGAGHSHGAEHSHGSGHSHGPVKRSGRDRLGMIGLGVAGGLVPSPTALLVLLGAIAFGRTAFGVALVLAYGLGMAATLTAAGLLLVRVRRSVLDRPVFVRLRAALPLTTSGLILLVGLGMAIRAASAFV